MFPIGLLLMKILTFFCLNRKCGRVVCGNCSSKSCNLSSKFVVLPPGQASLDPHRSFSYRTCDDCIHELVQSVQAASSNNNESSATAIPVAPQEAMSSSHFSMIPSNMLSYIYRNDHSSSKHRNSPAHAPTSSTSSSPTDSSPPVPAAPSSNAYEYDEENICPVCGKLFRHEATTEQREQHIEDCLKAAEFSGSVQDNVSHAHRRMIRYEISDQECQGLDECVICFEEFRPGDSVVRLECLCIYHEHCIMGWFSKKGDGKCPVHIVND